MAEPTIRLYVSRWCAECERAVALLERHQLAFETTDVGDADSRNLRRRAVATEPGTQ